MKFKANKKWIRFNISYHASSLKESGLNIDVDKEYAILIRTVEKTVISLRNESNGEWEDVDIGANQLYTLNVSKHDLLDARLSEPGSPRKLRLRSLGRTFTANNETLDDELDNLEANTKRFEWLNPITVVAS